MITTSCSSISTPFSSLSGSTSNSCVELYSQSSKKTSLDVLAELATPLSKSDSAPLCFLTTHEEKKELQVQEPVLDYAKYISQFHIPSEEDLCLLQTNPTACTKIIFRINCLNKMFRIKGVKTKMIAIDFCEELYACSLSQLEKMVSRFLPFQDKSVLLFLFSANGVIFMDKTITLKQIYKRPPFFFQYSWVYDHVYFLNNSLSDPPHPDCSTNKKKKEEHMAHATQTQTFSISLKLSYRTENFVLFLQKSNTFADLRNMLMNHDTNPKGQMCRFFIQNKTGYKTYVSLEDENKVLCVDFLQAHKTLSNKINVFFGVQEQEEEEKGNVVSNASNVKSCA